MIDCDEWKTVKRHERTNMWQIKRLELWWQLYVMWLPGRDVRNFRPMDFCSSECTCYVFPLWPSDISTINLVMFLKFLWLIYFWNYEENVSPWKNLFSAVLTAHKFLSVVSFLKFISHPAEALTCCILFLACFLNLYTPFLDIILPFLQCYTEKDHDIMWWRHSCFELSQGC